MERKSRPVVDLSAACACGKVTVRFAGKVLSMFLCSCEDCQKATGTGHSAILLARPGDVTITGSARSFARPANSGATLTRSFCPECGTPLVAHSSRAPDVLMLPVGLFGAAAADWYAPNQLIFARSHRDWDVLAAELPRHATYRDSGSHDVTTASDAMGERIRPLVKGLVEKKMFGGLGFMLNGNMLVGTTAKGALLVRVAPDRMDDALKRPGAYAMHMGPRVMTGFIAVDPDALPDAAAIKEWIAYARAYVKALPAK